MELIFTLTALNMKATGLMISNTDSERRHGSITVSTKGATSTRRRKAREDTSGPTETSTSETGKTTQSTDSVSTSGETAESTVESGN